MNILLLGKTGQTGFELHRTLSPGTGEAPRQKVIPIPTSDYPTSAKHPLNSKMEVAKLEQALSIQLPTWQSQLELTLGEYLEQ